MAFNEYSAGGVVLRSAGLLENAKGVRHGFSTRLGGVSTGVWSTMNLGTTRGDNPECVRENYRRFCRAAGADPSRLVMSNQVHGSEVRIVTTADIRADIYDPKGYTADGLITDIPGVALVVLSADCIPVLLYDPVRRVIAAVHAGWQGTARGIVLHAAEKMSGIYNCRPEHILAAIGPGISECCFETHEDVPNAMRGALGAASLPFSRPLGGGKYLVDLKGLNTLWLRKAGIFPEHIDIDGECTLCRPDKYWSHRAHRGERGSQIALIMLEGGY